MKSALVFFSCLLLSGCYQINESGLLATSQTPTVAAVPELSIPYAPDLPRVVVAVEPFAINSRSTLETNVTGYNRCIDGNCAVTTVARTLGDDVSAELITALLRVGNISVLDLKGLQTDRHGYYSASVGKNEVGPFLIRGTLSEMAEEIKASDEDHGVSLGWVGLVAGIAGAVAGKPGLGWSGAGVAAANPTFESELHRREGMVAFDVQIVDLRSKRIIGSNRIVGTYASESAKSGFSLFGISKNKQEFAQSVLGQAMRAAMNDAVGKIWSTLRERRV